MATPEEILLARQQAFRYLTAGRDSHSPDPYLQSIYDRRVRLATAFLQRTGGLPEATNPLYKDAVWQGNEPFPHMPPLGKGGQLASPTASKVVPTPTTRAPRKYQNTVESRIEENICDHLTAQGIPWERQVRTGAGIIDILTPTTLYEVKQILSRVAVLRAIGQLFFYQQDIWRPEMVIAGEHADENMLTEYAEVLGIRLEVWSEKTTQSGQSRQVRQS